MDNLAIRFSLEADNFQIKIYYPVGDRTPDLMNQRQTCYHLSQCGELINLSYPSYCVLFYYT